MRRFAIIAAGLGLALASSGAVAFEEQKMRPGGGAAAQPPPGSGTSAPPSTSLADPGVAPPRLDTGTKIRVPGLGVIGEIPKMDFGLELLYGANQPKQPDNDRTEPNGVMGRVTVPLKSR